MLLTSINVSLSKKQHTLQSPLHPDHRLEFYATLFYHLDNAHGGVIIKRGKLAQDCSVQALQRMHESIGDRQNAGEVDVRQRESFAPVLRKSFPKIGQLLIRP